MSSGPSTFGTMTTSSLSPMAGTRFVRSSSAHGESRLLIRVQNWVLPKSTVWPTFTRPARAASLSAIGMASSRLPSRMSTCGTRSGSLDVSFSFCGGKKWMTRLGRKGISRTGSGAPAARGLKKSRALRTTQG